MTENNGRIRALATAVSGFAEAALLFSQENRRYYTGFPATDGCLLVPASGEAVFWTDSRYTEAAAKQVRGAAVRETNTLPAVLAAYLKENNIKSVAVEASRLSVAKLHELQRHLPETAWMADGSLDAAVDAQRAAKTEAEVGSICKAQRIAEAAFEKLLAALAPGRTERAVALELDYTMLQLGAEALSFETIVVSGANGSMPHGVPSDKKIETGDFVTFDFGAVCDGYHSDMTRTVAVGAPSAKQREIYAVVLAAQEAALSVLRDGISGRDADAAARKIITEAGYGDCFGHGTGHGVGIEIHESPSLSPRSAATLGTGNVVTVEPGIYVPGLCGVRIEDMAYILPDGCRNLTKASKQLLCL